MRRVLGVVVAVLVGGCSAVSMKPQPGLFDGEAPAVELGAGDAASSGDGMTNPAVDLPGATSDDAATPDLAAPADAAVPPAPDLVSVAPADFTGVVLDLVSPPLPDLASTVDAVVPPADLGARPADLTGAPADLGVLGCNGACPQACSGGQCTGGGVACTPGARRCYLNVVQICNLAGSAWLEQSVCAGSCAGGLCTGACTPSDTRCDGTNQEVCAANGQGWTVLQSCMLGCASAVCIESDLTDHGNPMTLSGTHVYQGCVTVDLGATITVPPNLTLDLYARCFSLSQSGTMALGSGATLRVHASETIDLQGTVSGGNEVYLAAWRSLSNSGKVASQKVTLRGDLLTNGGSTSGAATAALYGASWTNTGMHGGAISVMPPEKLYSSTHPEGLWLNLSGPPVDVAWERPFPGAIGYYVSAGAGVPGPAQGSFSTVEHATVALASFGPGANRVRVVGVNGTSVVGTYPVDLNLLFNVRPPGVTSSSHPVEGAWGGVRDVFFAWSDPPGIPASAWTGYYYLFDHQAGTMPGAANGTFTTNKTLLLPGQANGIWYFHLVNVDRMGRTSPLGAHYQVRVGPDPGSGNVAGHVSDQATGLPIRGADIQLNGGLLDAYTDKTGDYTFQNQVPLSPLPYLVTASAPGYASATAMITVAAAGTQVLGFQLRAGAPPTGYQLGWEVQLSAQNPANPTLAVGPRGRYIWASVGAYGTGLERVAIVKSSGDEVVGEATLEGNYSWVQGTDVGWNGSLFWAVDNYRCSDTMAPQPGQGWSCLRMKTWDASGAPKNGWVPWYNSGQSGSDASAWNGASWASFFVSYTTIYEKALSPSLTFLDGNVMSNIKVTPTYGDTRESAYNAALWDGGGYALAYVFNDLAGSNQTLSFARYKQDLSVAQAPLSLVANPIGVPALAFDGTNYQVVYRTGYPTGTITLRTITPAGDASGMTAVATNIATAMGAPTEVPSMAWDRRYLVVAYASNDHGWLEARSPADRSLVFKQDLGPMRYPRIAFNATTGEGGLLYLRPDAPGVFLRPVTWN